MAYTVGTLFSGIGVPDLAAVMAGMEVLFHVEIEDYPRKVLQHHAARYWPHATLFADVRDCGAHNLPCVDVLIGGFPCQDVSFAGRREGMGKDTRSGLWWEFARIIGELQPRIVVIENVPGVLAPIKAEKPCFTPDTSTWFVRRARVRRTIAPPPAYQVAAELRRLGYVVSTGVISAADFGASHERKRWWCVAYAESVRSDRGRERGGGDTGAGRNQAREWQPPTSEVTGHRQSSVGNTAVIRRKQYPAKRGGVGTRQASGRLRQLARTSAGAAQSRLGGRPDAFTAWMDGHQRPVAGPTEPQYGWEAPRVVTTPPPNRAARLKALGNAWCFGNAYALLVTVRAWLEAADAVGGVA